MTKFHKAVWGGPDYSEGPDGVARTAREEGAEGIVIFGDAALTDEDMAALSAL